MKKMSLKRKKKAWCKPMQGQSSAKRGAIQILQKIGGKKERT
jgi:hypothetical protein